MAESGAEASLKEVPKKDLTAFAKAVSAAHEPSAFADWTTPSNPRRNNGRKGEVKSTTVSNKGCGGLLAPNGCCFCPNAFISILLHSYPFFTCTCIRSRVSAFSKIHRHSRR